MRCAFRFVLAAAVLVTLASVHAEEASCDFRQCMNICRSNYESGCAGMCGRIISLCNRLVSKPQRTRNARRNDSRHLPEQTSVDDETRGSLGHID